MAEQPEALLEVKVNGVPISEQDVAREMQYHQASSLDEARDLAARALVLRELMRQRAEKMALPDVDDESVYDDLIEREVTLPKVDDEACRAYYEKNRAHLRAEDKIEVSHILFSVAKEDSVGRHAALTQAETLIEQLRDNHALWQKLAAEHSACPSRLEGGYLGTLGKGQTVPEFERQLAFLHEGLADKPVETRYGVHIVYVHRKTPGRAMSYEDAKPIIADYLVETAYRHAVNQYLKRLVAFARIEGVSMSGDAVSGIGCGAGNGC